MGILEDAKKITDGARRETYGSMEKGHEIMADFWNTYLDGRQDPTATISAFDVAMMMILMKVARNANKPSYDNIVDVAGYARCASAIKGWEKDQYTDNQEVTI